MGIQGWSASKGGYRPAQSKPTFDLLFPYVKFRALGLVAGSSLHKHIDCVAVLSSNRVFPNSWEPKKSSNTT